jgi:hypothetical protein
MGGGRARTHRAGVGAALVLSASLAAVLMLSWWYHLNGAAGVVAVVGGLPGLWLAWLSYRDDRRDTAATAGDRFGPMMADLAAAVRRQWSKAAAERQLLVPAPIPVRWSLSDHPVTGPLEGAVAEGGPFAPLPGLRTITEQHLLGGGGRAELFALYGGLGSGRLVVVGGPGAGKTGAAVLLVLDALAHREAVAEPDRGLVPVPVLVTLHGWDPGIERFPDWLAGRLIVTYPSLFRGRQAAAQLVDLGRVAVVLDGLDEMAEALRPVALKALSEQAGMRVVVLTRTAEMIVASGIHFLLGAAVVELHPVRGVDAAAYLQRALPGPPPAGWDRLLDQLRRGDDDSVARALSTPLTLTLLRDTYWASDDLHELLTLAGHSDHQAVEDHLLDRVLTVAYSPHPGQRPPPYPMARAEQALRSIATLLTLDRSRDLAWWRIPDWAPAWPRVTTTSLVVGVGIGFGAGLGAGIRAGFGVGVAVGSAAGLIVGLSEPGAAESSPADPVASWRSDRSRGVALVLGGGLAGWLGLIFGGGFVGWLELGVGLGLGAGIVFSETWPLALAVIQLRRSAGTPLRLLRFLEDARARSVLRTVGPLYQFRHARLQDRLTDPELVVKGH